MSRPTDSMGFLTAAILVVLLVTLFPYEIPHPAGGFHRFDWEWDPGNVVGNIMLFLPLGFGLARLGRRTGPVAAIVLATFAGLVMSVGIEWLQTGLPSRAPSFPDVVTNTSGALLGAVAWLRWEDPILRAAEDLGRRFRPLATRWLPLVVLVWATLILGLEARSRRQVSLAGWDASYPLVLGNELTGDRPWRGWIADLELAAGTGTRASYRFDDRGGHPEPSHLLPPLAWQGTSYIDCAVAREELSAPGHACLGPDRWLTSTRPPGRWIGEAVARERFTVSVAVATADTSLRGPARLVSVSRDPHHRNLTLGQSGQDLVIRVRTPFTGSNGDRPEYVIPGIFTGNGPRRLTVDWDRGVARVRVEGRDEVFTMDLRYAAMLCGPIVRFDLRNLFGYRVIHHLMVAVLLALILMGAARGGRP